MFLAAVFAGSLWMALATPRPLRINRFAPHLGVVAGFGSVAGFLLLTRVTYDAPAPEALREVAGIGAVSWWLLAPPAAMFVVALVAGRSGGIRSGLRAGSWTGITTVPLMYSGWLYESLRRYEDLAVDKRGGLLLFGDSVPVAENLSTAQGTMLLVLAFGPPLAIFGASLGSRFSRSRSLSPRGW